MSDMIDRLTAISRDAGVNASASLNARTSLDSMQERVERGVRRRRQFVAGAAVTAVAVAGAGLAVLPRFVDGFESPLLPGTRAGIVDTKGALTVLSDGSMSVVTSSGAVVDIPAFEPANEVPFASLGRPQMCQGPDLADFPLGWEYHHESASELLKSGRAQFLLDSGPRFLAQGSVYYASSWYDRPALGLHLEADRAVAPFIVLRSAMWMVGEEGTVTYGTRLDAAPAVINEGGPSTGEAVSLLQTGQVRETGQCPPAAQDLSEESHFPRYLQVDVFVTDYSGTMTLIATHRSWSAVDFSRLPEDAR